MIRPCTLSLRGSSQDWVTTWCAVYTRPWYGMTIERLRGVENPSRRVTRENVAQQRPKMVHVKTTV